MIRHGQGFRNTCRQGYLSTLHIMDLPGKEQSPVHLLTGMMHPAKKESDNMDMESYEHSGFSLLEMSVSDGDDLMNVIFWGRWLVDLYSEPTAAQPQVARYTVALTPTDSYFVFREQAGAEEYRRYEVYDCFEWMEESLEVPENILAAVIITLDADSSTENEVFGQSSSGSNGAS
jgi:hypothetical protein